MDMIEEGEIEQIARQIRICYQSINSIFNLITPTRNDADLITVTVQNEKTKIRFNISRDEAMEFRATIGKILNEKSIRLQKKMKELCKKYLGD